MTYLMNQIAQLIQLSKKKADEEPYYEVLSYITFAGGTSSGVNFDTGITPNPNLKIDCTFRHSGLSNNTCVFGGRIATSGSDRKAFAFWNYVSGYMRADFGNTSSGTSDIGQSASYDDTWVNIVYDKDKFYLNGTLKWTSSVSTFTASDNACTITIGAMNSGTSTSSSRANYFKGDIQQLKIWDDDVLVRDYIPVLDSQMRPCFYDRVNKTFTYSTITPTYTRWNKYDVDYIQSSGTQYIDTGFKFTNTSAFEITCAEVADFESSTVLCGARDNTDTTTNARIVDYSYSAPSVLRGEYLLLQRGGYDVNENVIYIPYDKEFHTYYQSPTRMSIDDTERPTVPSLNSPNMNFYIFWQNVGTATAPAKAKIKVKNCKLWDNGTLVRDYKPSVRTYNNGSAVVTKAFLYDEVYNKAYDNAGTGSLKAYIIGYGNVFTRTGETTGKFIDADGNIQTNTNSAYSALLPIKGGETVSCKSGTASGNNYRYHVYDLSGNWIEQALVLNPSSAEAITGSFVAPSNASYMRVSYANANTSNSIEVYSSLATFEVGKSVSGNPSSSVSGVSNCFDTGLYGTQDTTVKYLAIAYDSTTSSGQLFGSYDGTQTTSKNLTINSTGTGSTAPIRFDGQVITTPIKIPANSFASIVTNKYGLWVNESLHGSWGSVNDFTTTTTMLILKCNNSTNTRNNGCCYCAIYESDKLIAEYIPVRNASNSTEFGLYDKVDKALNTGVGTLNFNALD